MITQSPYSRRLRRRSAIVARVDQPDDGSECDDSLPEGSAPPPTGFGLKSFLLHQQEAQEGIVLNRVERFPLAERRLARKRSWSSDYPDKPSVPPIAPEIALASSSSPPTSLSSFTIRPSAPPLTPTADSSPEGLTAAVPASVATPASMSYLRTTSLRATALSARRPDVTVRRRSTPVVDGSAANATRPTAGSPPSNGDGVFTDQRGDYNQNTGDSASSLLRAVLSASAPVLTTPPLSAPVVAATAPVVQHALPLSPFSTPVEGPSAVLSLLQREPTREQSEEQARLPSQVPFSIGIAPEATSERQRSGRDGIKKRIVQLQQRRGRVPATVDSRNFSVLHPIPHVHDRQKKPRTEGTKADATHSGGDGHDATLTRSPDDEPQKKDARHSAHDDGQEKDQTKPFFNSTRNQEGVQMDLSISELLHRHASDNSSHVSPLASPHNSESADSDGTLFRILRTDT